jgi:hypothetical protein
VGPFHLTEGDDAPIPVPVALVADGILPPDDGPELLPGRVGQRVLGLI